jgi:hypothetical protein
MIAIVQCESVGTIVIIHGIKIDVVGVVKSLDVKTNKVRQKGDRMQGLLPALMGRVGNIKFVKAAFVPDDTFIVSERTWDRIAAAFPEARQDTKESQATIFYNMET